MKKSRILKLSVIVSIVIVGILITTGCVIVLNSKQPLDIRGSTVEETVTKYLNFMANNKIVKTPDNLDSLATVGYDKPPEGFKLPKTGEITAKDIIQIQRDIVNEMFGEGAWTNVICKVVKTDCPYTVKGYRNIITGETVTEDEGSAINLKYYQDLLDGVGITAKECEILTQYAAYSYNQVVSDFSNNLYPGLRFKSVFTDQAIVMGYKPPVEEALVDKYEYYTVYFSFNTKDTTPKGHTDFRIIVGKPDGVFEVLDGLRWVIKR